MSSSSEVHGTVDPKDVARKMKIDYSRGIKDSTTKNLEAVCNLCWKLEQPILDQDAFIRETADMITKLFAIESVAIGVRDPVDGLYKYKAVVGLDEQVAKGYKDLAYTREQLFSPESYPCYEISSHTKLFLTEDHPYASGEEFTYRRPGLIGMKRRTLTDSLEADYLDFLFFDPQGDVMGFIESSGTRLRRLPDTSTIKWLELIAAILGVALQRQRS